MLIDSSFIPLHCAICSAAVSYLCIYFFLFFNDLCQTNCLKICGTDLRRMFRVDSTVTVDGQSEISFLIPEGALPWQPHPHTCLTALCPGLPRWVGTRRNIHPFTPTLIIRCGNQFCQFYPHSVSFTDIR